MHKRAIIFSALLAAVPALSGAYEKIEFKGQILSPAFMKLSGLTAA